MLTVLLLLSLLLLSVIIIFRFFDIESEACRSVGLRAHHNTMPVRVISAPFLFKFITTTKM